MKKVYCKTSTVVEGGAVKAYYSEGKVSVLQVSRGDCAQEAVVTVVTVVTVDVQSNAIRLDCTRLIYTVVPFS